jgi:hypothetical protein
VITSPLRPRDQQEPGVAAEGQLTHPRNALRRFTLVRNHNAPMASSRHALTEAPQRNQPHWDRPVNSGPRPCLFSVGFPLSGPQVRTHTSDLIRHALRTSARSTNSLRSSLGNPGAIPNPRASSSAACCSNSVLVLSFCVLLVVVVGKAISFALAYTVPRTLPDPDLASALSLKGTPRHLGVNRETWVVGLLV